MRLSRLHEGHDPQPQSWGELGIEDPHKDKVRDVVHDWVNPKSIGTISGFFAQVDFMRNLDRGAYVVANTGKRAAELLIEFYNKINQEKIYDNSELSDLGTTNYDIQAMPKVYRNDGIDGVKELKSEKTPFKWELNSSLKNKSFIEIAMFWNDYQICLNKANNTLYFDPGSGYGMLKDKDIGFLYNASSILTQAEIQLLAKANIIPEKFGKSSRAEPQPSHTLENFSLSSFLGDFEGAVLITEDMDKVNFR